MSSPQPRTALTTLIALAALTALPLAAAPAVGRDSCTITGAVTVDGRATPGVAVDLRREIDWQVLEHVTATADGAGRFTFLNLAPGWYRVSAFHVDAMPQSAGSWYCPGFGFTHEVSLALRRGGERIEGSVTDTDGVPLAGTVVTVNNAGTPKSIDGNAVIPSDDRGRFSVRLAEGASYNLFATAPGHRFGSFSVALRDGRPQQLGSADMKLVREPLITGVVVDAAGKPIGGAAVYRGPIGAKTPPERVVADATGRFVIGGLVEGDLVVTARAGALVGSARVGRMQQAEDAVARIVVKQGRTLRGTVSLDGGGKAAGADVMFRSMSTGALERVAADAAGSFTFEGLPPGEIEVRALGGKPVWTPLKPASDHVELRLVPPDR